MDSDFHTGVLTYHRCINYGSYWQARCLVEGLRARGSDAVLLDHDSRRVNHREWKCALRPVLPIPVPKADRTLYKSKVRSFLRAFSTLPLSHPFPLEHPEEVGTFEQMVVGSDEVWNLYHPWYSGCPLFFGDGVRANRLIAYAASFGNFDAPWGLDHYFTDCLRRFEAISVRDENSQRIIKDALGYEPELVLDPCLLFPPHVEVCETEPREPYVAVYGHNFSPPYIEGVRRWANSRGLPLVSTGYRNNWADSHWITAGPDGFAQFVAGAEAVATNFYHGCIFALNECKPFVCETSPYRGYKIQSLLGILGGMQHLVPDYPSPNAFNDALLAPPIPEVYRQIDHFRRTSTAYLDRALI